MPDVPLVPDVPSYPDVPEVPDVPLVPDVPSDPEVPDVPSDPEVPDVPSYPDVPLVPDVPEGPVAPIKAPISPLDNSIALHSIISLNIDDELELILNPDDVILDILQCLTVELFTKTV